MNTFTDMLKSIGEVGYVEEIVRSLYYVSGLPGAMMHEVLLFESGEFGQIFSIAEQTIEVLVFSKNPITVGTRVTRTGQFLSVPVGPELLGQTLDPLGVSLDNTKRRASPAASRLIDINPTGIDTRKKISRAFDTGVALVDLVIPLGKGQRELVIGDRKTGKTNFLMQTLLTQAKQGTICIYAAIGKKALDIKKVEEFMIMNKIYATSLIIATTSQDPSSSIFLTPYTAMTIAEYFRDQGRDTLLILDDLTTHAKYYREISLLGKRFPGRNSYPGDIFYTHAKLLERGGNFIHGDSEAAITVLPVVETAQGDLSGYIQTNIMSMTDGHLYFDNELFSKGRRPAINAFLSVTRVGRQTQSSIRRDINREIVSFLTLYEKMQSFVHFGADLNESVKNTLATGDKIIAFFDQLTYSIFDPRLQIFLFSLIWIGNWHSQTQDMMKVDINKIAQTYEAQVAMHTQINELVEKSSSFNILLNGVRKNQESVLSLAGVKIL